MAAPSNTKWGSIVGGYGRIGISVTVTNTNTTSSVHVEVWFWSKYSVSDTNNNYYYDNNATTATTNRGSINISTTVSSGSGWSTSNQKLLKETDYTYSRGTSAVKRNCAAKLSGVERVGGTMTVTTSYTIPALASYKITYNANGGSGAPGQQTKYYGKTLKLSTVKPTRTGYTFQGWGTSATGSVVYAPGANYTANAADTLYAIWKANTWTVTYNANGGSGAPAAQTKTYGVTLTLSSTKPTRTNYNFLGWGTSPDSTTVAYKEGASYTNNSAITLYAIWELSYVKPRITNLTADRCTLEGVLDDDGTYIKVAFDWATDKAISAADSYIQWVCQELNGSIERYYLNSLTGLTGSVNVVVGSGVIDPEYAWNITIHIKDEIDEEDFSVYLPSAKYLMDFKEGGTGVSIGETATYDGFAVNMDAVFRRQVVVDGTFNTTWVNTYSNGMPSFIKNIGFNNGYWLQLALSGNTDFVNLLRMNENNEVELNWTSGGLKGMVFKQLWTGTLSAGGKVTISELAYYNVFVLRCSGGATPIFALRMGPGDSAVRGSGAYPTSGNNGETFYVDATASGTSFTLDRLIRISHTEGDTHSAASNVNLTYIWGLF